MGKHAREAINASANKGLTSGASPGMRADSLSGAPTHSATAGMNGAPMTGAVGAGGLGGAGVVRSGAKSLGGLNSGNGSGQAGTGSGGTSASRPSAAVAQGRPQVMMPMGAMGGGAGAGGNTQRRNRGKVQTVTSAVERSGNLKALLGEQPPVVPGVIGDWVRG